MSVGFTPGPWSAWIVGKTVCVLGPKGDHSKPVVTWMGFDGCNRVLAEQKANARLIAAAPALYEALEGLIGFAESAEAKALVGDEGCLWPMEFARAALKQARGEA